jgi:hypothetical protein
MKRLQCLKASRKINGGNYSHQAPSASRQDMLKPNSNQHISKQIALMNDVEQRALQSQVNLQLARERRRCNARSMTYDVSRHIRLYLMQKALQGQS